MHHLMSITFLDSVKMNGNEAANLNARQEMKLALWSFDRPPFNYIFSTLWKRIQTIVSSC